MRNSLFALSTLILCAFTADAQQKSPATETIHDKILRSTVFIVTPVPNQTNRVATGSGSLVGSAPKSGNPVIITNYHVIAPSVGRNGDGEVRVMFPVRNARGDVNQNRDHYLDSLNDASFAFRGKVLAYQKTKDIALVELFVNKAIGQKLPAGLQFIPLAANSPKPSAPVHTVGNTGEGGMWSYTPGSVRGVIDDRTFRIRLPGETLDVTSRIIETTNPTNKGDSGGPLTNDAGELVGVTQGGSTTANLLSVFIDVQEVKALLRENKITIPKRTVMPLSATVQTPPKSESTASVAKSPPTPTLEPREREALSKLNNAKKALSRDKDPVLAESFIKDILDDYYDTKVAKEAKELLEEIKKKK